jgi:hypothetical protein
VTTAAAWWVYGWRRWARWFRWSLFGFGTTEIPFAPYVRGALCGAEGIVWSLSVTGLVAHSEVPRAGP